MYVNQLTCHETPVQHHSFLTCLLVIHINIIICFFTFSLKYFMHLNFMIQFLNRGDPINIIDVTTKFLKFPSLSFLHTDEIHFVCIVIFTVSLVIVLSELYSFAIVIHVFKFMSLVVLVIEFVSLKDLCLYVLFLTI
jgi:hypothetical protein